jgi:hypothetical protein
MGFFICALLPLLGIALYLVMPRARPEVAPLHEAEAMAAGDAGSA